jgi:hypothetical protein
MLGENDIVRKNFLSQLDQVYYKQFFTNTQNITIYKFIYKMYKYTIL